MENNNEGIDQGTPAENPAHTLADMPDFNQFRAEVEAKQDKSFTEAKRDGELPEGVRDESDYQEYMAEQKARAKENENLDNKLFEDIKSIEDPNDRDLVTAILPFYYNDSGLGQDNSNTIHAAKADAMNAIINCAKDGKTDHSSISEALHNAFAKYYDKDYDAAQYVDKITYARARKSSQLDELKEGQKIEKLNLSQANFNDNESCDFIIKKGEGNTRRIRFETNSLMYPDEDKRNATKVMLSIADSLAEKINEVDDYEKSYNNRTKLEILEESSRYNANVEKKLAEDKERRLIKFIDNAETIMDSKSYNRLESQISFRDGGVIGLVCTQELVEDFASQKRALHKYNRSLNLGKKILSGENWQDIDVYSDILYEPEE